MNNLGVIRKVLVLLLITFSSFTQGFDIHLSSTVPPLEHGSQEEVILNCDYDLREDERGQLDIKWYFNEDVVPFLQWVPGGGRRPQLIEPTLFQGHIDLDFKVDEDEDKAYRSIRILEPTLAMSGNYRCKVSTFGDEAFVEHQLMLFVPPKDVRLAHHLDTAGNVLNITCEIEEVFPQPIVKLLWNESELLPSETYVVESTVEAGLLDVVMLQRHMEIGEAEAQRIEVGCEMRLPSPLDVSVAKKLQIQLGSNEEDPEGSGDYFEDSGLFSGKEEIGVNETMEDYDQDWLNIYNDTEHSSGQDPLLDDIASCDTKTCDEEAEDIGETGGSAATSVRQAFKTLVISYLLQRLLQF